ncbi:DUF1800 domain-containing protein [Parablastomonas sp. CN1-191]|uniref:DUF1800 domain-containing protein n=1 Tax=Parablastomonas sp. CN1-191 TaxID=3400908 RepID=UPI003BF848D3
MSETSIALNRFGLGARIGDSPPADPRRWLKDQLTAFDPVPAPIAAQAKSPALVAMLDEIRQARALVRAAKQSGQAAAPAGGQYTGLRDAYVGAVGARTESALATPTPFAERLVHFWANHFAVSVDKMTTVGLAGAFEFEAIRPHVMGRFADLLGAVERHPAMLLYLDQAQSVGPGSPLGLRAAANGRKRGLNENLAREIMELHTLGVRTGYSQADVTEFARALTGWTVAGLGRLPGAGRNAGSFAFVPALHEPGVRTIVGKTFGQSGEAQGQAVLAMLAAHPSTARHIATKLARHFVADDPPPALVGRLEQAFLGSNGDLPTVYRALVDAPEAWSVESGKFRTPWEWGIAALRATASQDIVPQAATALFTQLGQPVWRPGSPAGWDDIAPSWAGPDALLRRVELSERLAARLTAPVDARSLAQTLFPGSVGTATREAVSRAESPAQGLALLLASPEMMRR